MSFGSGNLIALNFDIIMIFVTHKTKTNKKTKNVCE